LHPKAQGLNKSILPKQLKKLIDDESQHFTAKHIACMQGFDCSSPDPQERDLIESCKPILKEMGHDIYQDSLENYMREMMKEVKDPYVITGESRDPGATGKWTHLMGDVISSRTKIKRRNAQTETILQRWAEPFATIGWLVGGEYFTSALNLAWRYLLQNHPHDNICGAGIDQMEKDMIYRFDQSTIISQGIARRGMSAIQKRIDNQDIDVNESVITVFNPSPFMRSEVVTLYLDLPEKSNYQGFSIRDDENQNLPLVEIKRESYGTLVRNLQDISLQLRSERITLHTEFSNVPAYGYKTYRVKKEPKDQEKLAVKLDDQNPEKVMENEFLKVKIKDDGCLDVLEMGFADQFEQIEPYNLDIEEILMKKLLLILSVTGLAIGLLASPLSAQWPNHKMHHPQLPDLIGWDVMATSDYPPPGQGMTLADDWQCSETGPVLDIHFWGSWKDQDGIPETDDFESNMPWFTLRIWSNDPGPPSHPDSLLWEWSGEIPGIPSEPPTLEGWYDPIQPIPLDVIYNDHVPYWRYDFLLPAGVPAFIQQLLAETLFSSNLIIRPSRSSYTEPYRLAFSTLLNAIVVNASLDIRIDISHDRQLFPRTRSAYLPASLRYSLLLS